MCKDTNTGTDDTKNKGDDSMNTIAKRIAKRPCTILESIKQSFKEIKLYEAGKIKLKNIDEAFKEWEDLAKKTEKNEKRKSK